MIFFYSHPTTSQGHPQFSEETKLEILATSKEAEKHLSASGLSLLEKYSNISKEDIVPHILNIVSRVLIRSCQSSSLYGLSNAPRSAKAGFRHLPLPLHRKFTLPQPQSTTACMLPVHPRPPQTRSDLL